jgi:hypothetical protein
MNAYFKDKSGMNEWKNAGAYFQVRSSTYVGGVYVDTTRNVSVFDETLMKHAS